MANIHEVDVVIVGAGLAGLTAAMELQKRNISFVVLEARERSGGRIFSFKTAEDITIDMGAQWIGKNHYRIKKLLSQFQLKTVSTYGRGKTVFSLKGKTTMSGKPPLPVYAYIDFLQFTAKLNKVSNQINAKVPWNSALAKELDQMTMDQYVQANMYTTSGRNFYKFLIEEMICSALHEVSALDVLWCIKTAGSVQDIRKSEALWIKEGIGLLLEKMGDQISDKLVYDSAVTAITYEKGSAHVYTRKNHIWQAKRVIVAIPPNMQAKIQFEPPLPANRAQLLERSGLPSVTKVIIVYDKPFWRDKGLNGVIYSDQGPINETLDSSPSDGRRGVLTVLITGESARHCKEPEHEVVKALGEFFGPEALNPLQVFSKDWSNQPWTRGGYGVHFAPGVITNYGSSLLEPTACLHWAGTETATEWRLFMEGAVQSGERAAQEVIGHLERNRK
ncbi:FAD-dependent oxidoreductase [Anaerobacillus sp. CMMVII]|nr:FAD-dependent oxidoreductase [Anaerobacillus sp. CMMVII]